MPEIYNGTRHLGVAPLVDADRRALREPEQLSDRLRVDEVVGVDLGSHAYIVSLLTPEYKSCIQVSTT